jgi:hypothetical protein
MATWYLLNTTSIVSTSTPVGIPAKALAGSEFNDAVTPLAPWQAAGAIFWPSSDTVVAAAATLCQKLSANRGQNEDALDKVMAAAAANSLLAATSGAGGTSSVVFTETATFNLAAIQALTSGTPFNVGAALPANAVLLGAVVTWTAITGGGISACHLVLGDATTANDILTSTDVWTASGSVNASAFSSRPAGQVKGTLTAVGAALSAATAGAVSVALYYVNP